MASSLWETDNPLRLYDIALKYIIQNKYLFTDYDPEPHTGGYTLKQDIKFPSRVCDDLVQAQKELGNELVDDRFMQIFRDSKCTRLQSINLSNTKITEECLEMLMKHKPIRLNISGCKDMCSLHSNALKIISTGGAGLRTLYIGDSIRYLIQNEALLTCLASVDEEGQGDWDEHFIFQFPNLTTLSLHHLTNSEFDITDLKGSIGASEFVNAMLQPLNGLTCLDLMGCHIDFDSVDLSHLTSLMELNLSDVPIPSSFLFQTFEFISRLTKLRILKLCQGKRGLVNYKQPEDAMRMLLPSLEQLEYLDLSDTNLPGFLPSVPQQHRLLPTDNSPPPELPPAIPGLNLTGNRKLEFLGLLGCPDEACRRENLPAIRVTGDANEQQVVLSIHAYINQPELLMKALNNLFHLFRFSEVIDQRGALQGILSAMTKHPADKHVQISGSASLFYIMKGAEKKSMNKQLKKRVVKCLLSAMENHIDESTMLRNGMLTLCHFTVPQDLLFHYGPVVRLLLRIIGMEGQEEFVQRIGVYLINSMACQVDSKQKLLVGELRAIEHMLSLIELKLKANVCDEVMEIAWSAMWNVTDETPQNCQRFIENKGMELFLECMRTFPDKDELLRNMMGLIGNVAEVAALRPRLMDASYVTVFCDLLESESDGIEVSYNACGVLAHLVADGEEAWTCPSPLRSIVLHKMCHAIKHWKLKSKRNINYRSFAPILNLLPKFETPEAQYWATWALCNLTKMYKNRYCLLLEKEGGLDLLKTIVDDPRPYENIKKLAREVLDRCAKYKILMKDLPDRCEDDTDEDEDEDAMEVVDSGDEADDDGGDDDDGMFMLDG